VLFLTATEKTVRERWMKKNEADDVPEDALEALKADSATNSARRETLRAHFELFGERCQIMQINTTNVGSIESLTKDLNNKFSPKVILVNHEKKLSVDNVCSNLAIKYNMIYISAYQVIRQHIEQKTSWGHKLLASCRRKGTIEALNIRDDFQEAAFSPVHFDLTLVMQLLKETVSQKKTNQKFVLIEGLCNSNKLSQEDDQLELRFMDEFFSIEAILGEVKAVVGLQHVAESGIIDELRAEYEQFPEEPVVEAKPKPAEGEEEEEPPADGEEEGEKKAPAFKKEDFKWTITNRKSKNLPQLFQSVKGINTQHEDKKADSFGED